MQAPASAAAVCGTPGRDGTSTITGIVNTYFPGSASAAAGATSITVGAYAAGGANTAVASGDLLLVVQMQGATLNTSNSTSYGDGSGTGSGATSVVAGRYEYVVAQSALTTSGGSVTIKGTGSGGGLNYAYSVGTNVKYQVIRVPQYNAPTIGGALVPLAWNGATGGVLAIDSENLTNGNGATIAADYIGFRGGGARQLSGSSTPGAGDFVNSNAYNAHAQKGEGIAGTPTYTFVGSGTTEPGSGTEAGSGTADGYTGGDMGRGAPGNAGGGGADSDPVNNDMNSGGGGGGNGGAGGMGGKTWSSNLAYGGRGGTYTPASTTAVMGGGGGAGTRNNGSAATQSSGGSGGAIVMIRTAGVTGGLTVSVGGSMGVEPENDGGAGGGAGGTVVLTATASLAGVTVNANGANGTDADLLNSSGASHGPGGGGGGGVIVESGGLTTNVNGGVAGTTDGSPTPDAHYGAVAGGTGTVYTVSPTAITGAASGAECGSSSTTGLLIGPVGVANATGSYDGSVAVTNDNDFIEKSFTPTGFNAINTSTTPGSPTGNAYTTGGTVTIRHQVHNYGSTTCACIFYAQAPSSPGTWTVGIYLDNAGAIGAEIGGTASTNTYQTTTTESIAAGADYYVWTQYAVPTGMTAVTRFDALIAVIDSGTTTNNNEVHDEIYTGFLPQTKSYVITTPNCSGTPPAGDWCPGGTLTYSIDIRNIAIPTSGTEPAAAILSATTVTMTDDGSATNSWAKDGGYMNTPGLTTAGTATAPTTLTYYYNATSSTTFPANYSTTNKVFKFTAAWTGASAIAAGTYRTITFPAIQF